MAEEEPFRVCLRIRSVPHMLLAKQLPSWHSQEAVISSRLLKKCKNLQWGHRWPLRAKGWHKQLFAHTNVQQP